MRNNHHRAALLSKTSNLQQKIMRHEKNKKLTHIQEKNQLAETISEEAQILDSADKDFKAAIVSMFKSFLKIIKIIKV